MRICLLSREYPPDTGWGGIGAYTYQHAHGLKQLGHDVEVVALAKKEQICRLVVRLHTNMARRLEAGVETKESDAQEKMLEWLFLSFDLPAKAGS